jgi:hypothetical protein
MAKKITGGVHLNDIPKIPIYDDDGNLYRLTMRQRGQYLLNFIPKSQPPVVEKKISTSLYKEGGHQPPYGPTDFDHPVQPDAEKAALVESEVKPDPPPSAEASSATPQNPAHPGEEYGAGKNDKFVPDF